MSKDYMDKRNAYDGFDNSCSVHSYDEKKEKWYEASIWVCIAVISGMILLYTIVEHSCEIYRMYWGKCVEAYYDEDRRIAVYTDQEGKEYKLTLGSYEPVYEGNTVKLYYTESIINARPANTMISWLRYYAFFGTLFGLSIWRIVKTYKKKHY